MIKILEKLEKEYKKTTTDINSELEAFKFIEEAKKTSENYRTLINISKNNQTEEIVTLQERILDGFDYEIKEISNSINSSNYSELSKLIKFLINKLQINIWITEHEKMNYYINISENSLPKENSIFIEIFFLQKFEEITSKKLIKKKN